MHTHTHTEEEQTAKQVARFNELCEMKLKIVEERNELVMQTEEDRTRYRKGGGGRKRGPGTMQEEEEGG